MGTINIQSTDLSHKAGLTYTGTSDKTIDVNNVLQTSDTTASIASGKVVVDSSGNVGIGATPSGWNTASYSVLEMPYGTSLVAQKDNNVAMLSTNVYVNSSYQDVYKTNGYATRLQQDAGRLRFFTAPSGTAGNAITWTNAMTLDVSGNLLVGATSTAYGARSLFNTSTTAGAVTLWRANSADVMAVETTNAVNGSWSSAARVLAIGKDTVTNRSINAVGTINASGADYAEYEYNNGLLISKGSIVGFKADGTLTDKYSESIRFAIKSTNPSYVGNDIWGSEDIVGKKPEQPTRKQDVTEQKLVSEAVAEVTEDKIIDAVLDDDGNEIEPSKIEKVIITPAQEAIYETVIVEAGDTDAEWEAKETQYKADLADFEARLEAERIKVDRIAYSGKVPVNVTGAVAGQYVCVVAGENDSIGYELVNKVDMTFGQYQDAVGRVNRILDDGRAEVAVVIH